MKNWIECKASVWSEFCRVRFSNMTLSTAGGAEILQSNMNVCFHIKPGYSSKQLLKRKWFSTSDSITAPLEFVLGNGRQMSQERSLVQH